MTSAEIRSQVLEAGFKNACIFITDADYARPTTNFLTGKFYNFYKNWLSEHNIDTWQAKWDCDNFSSTYYTFTQICHANAGRNEQGISVGEFFYKIGGNGTGHAINIAVTEKGVIFIEPQTGKEVGLSEEEMLSCPLVRF